MKPIKLEASVVVVGGGPAGLTAATKLREMGVGRVILLERDAQAGGVPRYCHHPGFGMTDLYRFTTGPRYVKALIRRALRSGVDIFTETTAIAWENDHTVVTSSPQGHQKIFAQVILIATGCRERPRPAMLIPGTRPLGVFTTGNLQQLAQTLGTPLGTQAVIVGAEHVSFSAAHTLINNCVDVKAFITHHPWHQTFGPILWWFDLFHRIPIYGNTLVKNLCGSSRLEGVEILNTKTGESRTVECDTLVFTGNWIPETEWTRIGGVSLDPATNGPLVDQTLCTEYPHIFAAGNVLRGAERADVAAQEGARVAKQIFNYLHGKKPASKTRIPIHVDHPLLWVQPQTISIETHNIPVGEYFFVQSKTFVNKATLEIRQGKELLYTKYFQRLIPSRSKRISPSWIKSIQQNSEPIIIRVS